jgi:hypothetical protein
MEGAMGSVVAEIAARAGVRLREAAGMQLVPAREAGVFLDACLTAGTRIIGIEGFDVLAGDVRPDMNAIADFSDIDDPRESIEEARRFLAVIEDEELALEFVIDDQ